MMDQKEKIGYIADHYAKPMHTAAFHILNDYHEAEDACQESFLKLYNAVARIEDVTTASARAYCVTTARNTAVDMARKKARQIPAGNAVINPEDVAAFDSYPSDTEGMIGDIEELPEKYRNIIRMRCLEEKSAGETAEILNSSIGTVNTQLSRARSILKSKWFRIACFGLGFFLLCTGTVLWGLFGPAVQYSTERIDEAGGTPSYEKDAEAVTSEAAAETEDRPLSDSGFFRNLNRIALTEVEGAGEENITGTELKEEKEDQFSYYVTIEYEQRTHVICMSVDGKVISHEVR